jgi:putative aldouronate transport system substrate-binding protein
MLKEELSMAKKFLKAVALIMTMAMVLTLAACGGGTSTSDTSGSTTAAPAETEPAPTAPAEKLVFSYTLPGKFVDSFSAMHIFAELQKQANAEITLVNGGDGDAHYQNIDLNIGSGTLKDAVIVKQTQSAVYGSQGAFEDLAPLIDKYAPNIKKYIDSNPSYKAMIETNGKIYAIAGEQPLTPKLTFYRADMFEAAGITAIPTTIAEFTAALQKLKTKYSSVQGYYPLTGRDYYLRYGEAFGALDYIDSNGKVHGVFAGSKGEGIGYDVHSAGFREMVAWYAQLYKDELIDPEYVTGIISEESYAAKFLSNKASVADDSHSRPNIFNTTADKTANPTFDVKVMDLFKDQNGNVVKRHYESIHTDRYLAIMKGSPNAVSIIKFLNYCFSEEGKNLIYYGIDGVDSQVVNGKREWLKDADGKDIKGIPSQNSLTFPYPLSNEAYFSMLNPAIAAYDVPYVNKFVGASVQLVYSTEQSKERSTLMAKYQPKFDAEVLGFVTGKTALTDANWNTFLKAMDDAGYTRINQIDQAAYDAMK